MSLGTTTTFRMPEDWTLRKVATAIVREWLPPFRVEPGAKAVRWVVQFVVEQPDKDEPPLWEAGISTEEYEERLDRTDLGWAIRISAGRGKNTILARLVPDKERPDTFHLLDTQGTFPETLFEADKLAEFLKEHNTTAENFFAALLMENGFKPAN